MKNKIGILLLNIGSPRSYEVQDVKKYLRRFLMDKEIISLPFVLRWILVNLIIVPKRGPYSAANYKKVWTDKGSPLIVHSDDFKEQLQVALGDQFIVRTGMAFSSPDIEEALLDIQSHHPQKIIAVPLFPQYADATTRSVSNVVREKAKKHRIATPIHFFKPFYDSDAYNNNTVRVAKEFLTGKNIEHYLFSYHGLPESQIRRNSFCQVNDSCCSQMSSCQSNCYRAQCVRNTEIIAQKLGLKKEQYSYSFQSRLGRAKWIGPDTEQTLQDLAQKGTKNIAVLCPSFVADCIETIEEIGMGGREVFEHHGGREFHLVPCLNSDPQWAQDFAELLQK